MEESITITLDETEHNYIKALLDLHCYRLEHDNDNDCRERLDSHALAKWVHGIIQKLGDKK